MDYGEMRNELSALRIYDNINFYPSVESPKTAFGNKLPNAKYVEYTSLTAALDHLNQKMSAAKPTTVILTADETQMRRRRAAEEGESTNVTFFAYGTKCAAVLSAASILDQTKGIDGKNFNNFDINNISLSCADNTSTLTINFKNKSERTLNITTAT